MTKRVTFVADDKNGERDQRTERGLCLYAGRRPGQRGIGSRVHRPLAAAAGRE